MKPIRMAGLLAMTGLLLGGCSLFGRKPEQAVTTHSAARLKVAVIGPIVPGGPPMPLRKPTATAGATIIVPPKAIITAAIARPTTKTKPDAVGAVAVPPHPAVRHAGINADTLAPTICSHTDELMADEVRRLQTTLLIATLHCQKAPQLKAQITASYNQYVKTFGHQMLQRSIVLQSLFKRQYGHNGIRKYDLYVTAMANEFSQDSMADPLRYCQDAVKALKDLNQLKSKDLGHYAHSSAFVVHSAVAKGC